MLRQDFEGAYFEELDLSPGAVDLSQLRGAPVLDNHDRYAGVAAILGVVETAAVDGKRGVATVRFGVRQEIAGIVADVRGGIIRNVSAGYTVQQWTVSKRADGARVKRATKWTPREISFVPLGADPKAQVRNSETAQQGECMNLQEQLRSVAGVVGVPEQFADQVAQRAGVTMESGRAEIIREAARLQPVIDARAPQVTITRDESEGVIARMADGLRARMNPRHTPTGGREFAHFGFADIARRCLETRGLSVLGSRADLITRALHTTSDFAAVLQEAYNKELLMLKPAESPVAQVFKRATVSDFRNRHIFEMSSGPALEKVNEKGEVKYGAVSDKELASYKIDSYARGYAITHKVLVNDDLAALSDITAQGGRGARIWFSSFLVDTIIANPKLADSLAVFHANHSNLAASGAVPSEATIGAGKTAIRLQKDISGNPIDAAPKFILAPAALETTIDKLMAQLYPVTPADAQVSGRGLTPIIDPRLDAKAQAAAWYLFADPAEAPVFEYAELEGYAGPQVEARQGFDTLGIEIRVVWHVGAGAIDSRGAWKNPGA